MSLPNPFLAKPHPDSVDDSDENGVYAITKKTDYWFNREAYQIEQEAKVLAAEWAEKGLPRHDVERAGAFEPEQVLAMKCLELFRQWRKRVRVKMQDAIAGEADTVAAEVSRVRATSDRLGQLRDGVRSLDEELTSLQRKEGDERPAIGFEPLCSEPASLRCDLCAEIEVAFTIERRHVRVAFPMNERHENGKTVLPLVRQRVPTPPRKGAEPGCAVVG